MCKKVISFTGKIGFPDFLTYYVNSEYFTTNLQVILKLHTMSMYILSVKVIYILVQIKYTLFSYHVRTEENVSNEYFVQYIVGTEQ